MTWDQDLLTADKTPKGLIAPGEHGVTRRFDVYRNNVLSSLVQALRDGFPTIQRLVGEEFFAAMAASFARAHPPASPILSKYGTEFPDWLQGFAPVAHLPYLPDVARLELAMRRAYHAADVPGIDPKRLSDPSLADARLHLAPAVTVISSRFPVLSIWQANQQRHVPQVTMCPEAVLVTRPDWDPLVDLIPAPEAAFIRDLATVPLGNAISEDLDLPTALARLLSRNAIVDIEVPE